MVLLSHLTENLAKMDMMCHYLFIITHLTHGVDKSKVLKNIKL